eukprot:8389494-Alexandrium_andersonii.AAC.1
MAQAEPVLLERASAVWLKLKGHVGGGGFLLGARARGPIAAAFQALTWLRWARRLQVSAAWPALDH